MPFYERQPYITPLYQVLLELLRGELRVPRFQRPGTEKTWTPDQRGDLLDSLYRSFPVGTILLWSTNQEVATLNSVGGFTFNYAKAKGPTRLLLDGHQRLSTLLAILGPGLRAELEPAPPYANVLEEHWVFDAGPEPAGERNSTRERFRKLKGNAEPSGTQVPLERLLNRTQMNAWIRDHEASLGEEGVRLAEGVRDKLREYTVPVAVLAAESLEDATESFQRVNSSGTPMGTAQMVAALAYTSELDLDEVLTEHIEEKLLGWDDLDRTDILRVCAGLAGRHPVKLDVAVVAKLLRENSEMAERAVAACARGARDLERLGVLGPKALPYAWQLVTLAIVLGRRPGAGDLGEGAAEGLRRWFWVTTYGEVFGGVNSAVYDRAIKALESMMDGAGWQETPVARDVTRYVGEISRFDYRAARSKAFALRLADVFDDGSPSGDAHRALAAQGVDALHLLRSTQARSKWSELVVLPDAGTLREVREQLKGSAQPLLLSDGSITALQLGFDPHGAGGDLDARMVGRKAHLLALEQKFVEELGLEWK